MIEADGTAGFEIVHPELRTGLTLLRGAERGKAQYIGGLVVKELCEAALKVVIRGYVVEKIFFSC